MSDSSDILGTLEARAEDISKRFDIRRLGVFGSVARLEAYPNSDLVMIETLKPALRDRVLAEAHYVA